MLKEEKLITTSYYGEVQALYLGLFDILPNQNGLAYWQEQLSSNPTGALDALSVYAGLGGLLSNGAAPLSSSNIGSEINSIYENLFGTPVTSNGENYWSSQWTGDGGTLSIGQITAEIYNDVKGQGTGTYYTAMNDTMTNFNNEAQALYLGLFGAPASTLNGQDFWGSQLSINPTSALNAISSFATYGGAHLTSSNIGSEINSIYENLFGTPVTASGANYWSSQWTGNGGTMSIGQITADIYNIVESQGTGTYYTVMNENISNANNITDFNNTLGNISADTNPTTYTITADGANYSFPVASTQPDTLVISFSYQNSNPPTSSNGYTYADYSFQGDASGNNTVDINYATGGSYLHYYLQNAANFQTLDFNYQGSNSFTLNLNDINSGFNTFVLDNGGTNASDYTFQNVGNNDTFIVQSAVPNSDWVILTESTNANIANLILEGVSLQDVSIAPSSNNISTINIDSYGTGAANSIAWFDNANTGSVSSANALNSTIINIDGTQSLTIGNINYGYGTGIFYINGGETITVNGDLSGSNSVLTLNYTSVNNGSSTEGATINASGYSGTLAITSSSNQQLNDNVILGSGTDTFTTNSGSYTITVGSGNDTIIDNSTPYSTNNYYITTVQGNINANDSISFNYNNMIIQSFTQLNESSASTEYNAISAAIATLNAANTDTAANVNYGTAILADAWFTYGGNTYIVNSYNSGYNVYFYDKVVQLVGTYDLSGVSYNANTTATISHL